MSFPIPKCYAEMAPIGVPWHGMLTVNVKPAKGGFIIHRMSHYITYERIKFTYGLNGTLKAKGITEKNYCAPVRFTEYYHNGVEVTQSEYKQLNTKSGGKSNCLAP